MGQAQINVRTRACSRTSIARTKQAALTHNVRGKELKSICCQFNQFIMPLSVRLSPTKVSSENNEVPNKQALL